MAWETVKSIDRGTATLWRDRESGTWAVTADRPQRDTDRVFLVQPTYDSNHPRSRKAALEVWRERQYNPAAVALGSLGGKAKHAKLTPEQRSQQAREMAAKRWADKAPRKRAKSATRRGVTE